MFSPYLLLKLVRRSQAMRSKSTKDKPIINIEKDRYSHMSNKCRVCLQAGEIPIFGSIEHPDISEPMKNFADIEISLNDKLPKLLCDDCHKLLQAAIVFRSTAKQTDFVLRQTKRLKNSDEESDSDIDQTDMVVETNEEIESRESNQHKKKKKYHCKVCYIDFQTINEYYDHVNTPEHKIQKKNPDIQCKVCNKTLRRHYYRQHLQLHALEGGLNTIQCKICKQSYKKGDYSRHIKTHNNVDTNYICDTCGKSFAKRNIYRCHLQTHSSEFPYECEYCPYKGRNMSLLKTHVRTHTKDYRYNCSECSARFLTSSNLNRHMSKHKGRNIECDTCKRKFYTKCELQQHFKVDHLGIKDYICSVCDKAFGYRNALKKHQLHVHKRQKFINGKGRMPAYLAAKQNQQLN